MKAGGHTDLRRRFLLPGLAVVLPLALLGAAAEGTIRLHHLVQRLRTGNSTSSLALDDDLGWRATANYRFAGWKLNAAGERERVVVTTDGEGFRLRGRGGAGRRFLVVGDSYTHALDASDDETYYARLGATLGVEVDAYGAAGYGTLQEYLFLDEHLDRIRPDAVLLQLCSNDIINNSYDLERGSVVNNNGLRRPYLGADGAISRRLPRPAPWLRHLANSRLRSLYWLLARLDRRRAARGGGETEARIAAQGDRYPPFAEAVEVTRRVFAMIRRRVPAAVPIYAFSVDGGDPYEDALRRLAEQNGMRYVDGVPQALAAAEGTGMTTRAADGAHWNGRGHGVAAAALAEALAPLAGGGVPSPH